MECLNFLSRRHYALIGFAGIFLSNLLYASERVNSPSGLTGSQFMRMTMADSYSNREQAIQEAFLAGNFPSFLAQFKPVVLNHQGNKLVIMVSPDYLAIGDDDDFVRMPMGLDTALNIARQLDCILPTSRIVDAIYEQADLKIEAYFLPPSRAMVSNSYYLKHHEWVQSQLLDQVGHQGLISGHKKDVVLTRRLFNQSNRVAIYGWPRIRDRSPIQPLSTWHGRSYADYSHGIRLVSRIAWLNGSEVDLYDVFRDEKLSSLVSDEGAFDIEALMDSKSQQAIVLAH